VIRTLRNCLAGLCRPKISTEQFVTRLFERHGDGLADYLAAIREHNVSSRARHGLSGGSTGTPDCGFLYLLVKAFARRHVFEIGTYVGTSAVAMAGAAREHGGRVTTCDPQDYGCLPARDRADIRFLQMPADDALARLKGAGETIDFVFADWAPSPRTIGLFNELGTADMIFTAHDYVPPDDKGVVAQRLMSRHYRRRRECSWFLPESEPIRVAPDLLLQQSVAALIPNHLLASFR
jgi:hypothetical protein